MHGQPFLADQEAARKQEAAAAQIAEKRDAQDRELMEYNRQQNLDEMKRDKARTGAATNVAPQRANSRVEAAEKARLATVARQVDKSEAARRASKSKGPSAAFLETQARFDDAQKRSVVAASSEQDSKIEAAARKDAMTSEQRKLLRLEIDECQRSSRTPDQLSPAEIAAMRTQARVQP